MVSISGTTSANSLWLGGNDLYSSKGNKEYCLGDIITIEIEEESAAQSRATTSTQKGAKTEITTGPDIPLFEGVMKKFVGNNEVKNEYDGEGTTTRSGKLSGTVTATVLKVMDNGNLLIEGSRSIVVNKETQIMRVRGVARPHDIDSNNTINSSLLADAQIKYDGKGAIARANRQGILSRIIDTIF